MSIFQNWVKMLTSRSKKFYEQTKYTYTHAPTNKHKNTFRHILVKSLKIKVNFFKATRGKRQITFKKANKS